MNRATRVVGIRRRQYNFCMTPHLTSEMRQALAEHPGQPVFVIDDATSKSYVLLPAEAYMTAPAVQVYDGIYSLDPKLLAKVLAVAEELFGGKASVCESFDPEYPNDKYPVVSVTTRLDPKDAVHAELQWSDRLDAIAPAWTELRLGVHFAQ